MTEELNKVREDKTDEELEKKRKQQIADLIEVNEKYLKQIEVLSNTNFFKRAWAWIVSKDNVRKEAIKEMEQLKQKVNSIVEDNGGSSYPFWF